MVTQPNPMMTTGSTGTSVISSPTAPNAIVKAIAVREPIRAATAPANGEITPVSQRR